MKSSAAAQYALQERIGRGAFGVVYRAVPRAGGAPVAIKIIELEEMSDEIDKHDEAPSSYARFAEITCNIRRDHMYSLPSS